MPVNKVSFRISNAVVKVRLLYSGHYQIGSGITDYLTVDMTR